MVGCELPFGIGYKGYLVGTEFQYQIDEFLFAAVAFNIEFGLYDCFYLTGIVVSDMSFVRPGVDRHAVRSETLYINGSLPDIWIVTAATVAERGDLVDIDG
jgi:hypothetical protein